MWAVFLWGGLAAAIPGRTSRAARYSGRHIGWMWSAYVVVCAIMPAFGYALGAAAHLEGVYSEAFAGGAILTMLANSMLPEAFEHGGRSVGLLVVVGYLVAAVLSITQ